MSADIISKCGLGGVKNILLILSGKGGVGKSTVATQLAVGLWQKGYRIGLLDVDLCGPSVPRMLGLEGLQVHQCPEGWIPVYADLGEQRLAVMSIGFLLSNQDEAVVWRGPKKNALIAQLLNDVRWGDLDWLIVDTPPGTSDEHISVVEKLKEKHASSLAGAVIVTTPQLISLSDVRRELSFCVKTGVRIVGMVENMSGFRCPHCTECTNVFSTGGGEALAQERGVPFLGRLAVNCSLTELSDSGKGFMETYSKDKSTDDIMQLTDKVIAAVRDRSS